MAFKVNLFSRLFPNVFDDFDVFKMFLTLCPDDLKDLEPSRDTDTDLNRFVLALYSGVENLNSKIDNVMDECTNKACKNILESLGNTPNASSIVTDILKNYRLDANREFNILSKQVDIDELIEKCITDTCKNIIGVIKKYRNVLPVATTNLTKIILNNTDILGEMQAYFKPSSNKWVVQDNIGVVEKKDKKGETKFIPLSYGADLEDFETNPKYVSEDILASLTTVVDKGDMSERSIIGDDEVGHIIPQSVCYNMIDTLDRGTNFFELQYSDSFDEESYINSHRVIDISCKSGGLLCMCYVKFSYSLSLVIEDSLERYKFIWKNLIFALCPDDITALYTRLNLYNGYQHGNVEKLDLAGVDNYKKAIGGIFGDMKFDVVVGNPPYQHKNGGASIYQEFGCKMYESSSRYVLMICPDRWNSSNQSNSFKVFRKYLLDENHLTNLVHIASDKGRTFVFGDIGTKELTYFLVDKQDNSNECLLTELDSDGNLVNKSVVNIMNPFYYNVTFMNMLSKINAKCNKFMTNIENLTFAELDTVEDDKCSNIEDDIHSLKVYGTRGTHGFISPTELKHDYVSLNKWKVLLARNGVSSIVAEPNCLAARTYYMFYFDSKIEAENCCKYFQSKFFRAMTNILRNGLYTSKSNYAVIPYLDFSKDWNDDSINQYFGFDDKEKFFILNSTH